MKNMRTATTNIKQFVSETDLMSTTTSPPPHFTFS